jgi:metallo-beta-lactamase family protein
VISGLFLNHGDDEARAELKLLLAQKGVPAERIFLPQFDECFELVAGTAQSKGRAPRRLDEAAVHGDWYSDFASFNLELANQLEAAADNDAKRALIERLNAALGG